MLGMMVCRVLVLGQLLVGPGGNGAAPDAGAAPATQPTTQPATQPAAMQREGLLDVFGKTRLGKLARGEGEPLTIDDLKQPAFWIDTIKELIVATVGFIPRLIVALIFLCLFWLIYRGLRRVVVGPMGKASVDQSIRDMVGLLIKWGVLGFGLVIACNQIGIQITALLTGVSLIGLAIGFAAQETISNFIAGIVIFWDKPFKVGDWVEIDGTYGQIKRITFRSTRMLNSDGVMIVMPNTQMLSNKLSNYSVNPISKVKVPIGIAYKESIDRARQVLLGLVAGDARVCKDPAPGVGVAQCADSSVNLVLSFWVTDASTGRGMYGEYLEKAKNAMDTAGIEMPFPHMQLVFEVSAGLKTLLAAARS
jgi:small conductance mechanosensitive channel